MRRYYNSHTIWLAMMLLTVWVYVMAESGSSGFWLVQFIFLITIIKGSLIIREFMSLKGVSLLWRVIMYGWLWVVCLTISVIYLVGT
ncbi:MAG: cytochrome C oxidase subunit IV family protein [Methylophagaceae bacterium]